MVLAMRHHAPPCLVINKTATLEQVTAEEESNGGLFYGATGSVRRHETWTHSGRSSTSDSGSKNRPTYRYVVQHFLMLFVASITCCMRKASFLAPAGLNEAK